MASKQLLRKALVFQSLFFCMLSAFAQADLTLEPAEDTLLQEQQDFQLKVTGAEPVLVRVYLNGAVIQELRQAPFQFQLALETSLANTVRLDVTFADGSSQTLSRTYQPPRVDDAELVDTFQIFPYLDGPFNGQEVDFESGRRDIKPDRFESANNFPLEMVICLDVSGSMRWELETVRPLLITLMTYLQEQQAKVHFMVFDQNPRLLNQEQLLALEQWELLYQGSAKSVVWDSLATATGFFGESPRRTILLISDGFDSGSIHNEESVRPFIRQSGASLLWMNPFLQTPGRVLDLAKDSGGFMIRGSETEDYGALVNRLQHQMWLVAPQARFPIDLNVDDLDEWFPRWED